jgi:hypothetical protein
LKIIISLEITTQIQFFLIDKRPDLKEFNVSPSCKLVFGIFSMMLLNFSRRLFTFSSLISFTEILSIITSSGLKTRVGSTNLTTIPVYKIEFLSDEGKIHLVILGR